MKRLTPKGFYSEIFIGTMRHDDRVFEFAEAYHAHCQESAWISADCPPEDGGRYWCLIERPNDLGIETFQWNCSYGKNDGWSESGVKYYRPLPPLPSKISENK